MFRIILIAYIVILLIAYKLNNLPLALSIIGIFIELILIKEGINGVKNKNVNIIGSHYTDRYSWTIVKGKKAVIWGWFYLVLAVVLPIIITFLLWGIFHL